MGEVLSHAEVEAILSALAPASQPRQPLEAPINQGKGAVPEWQPHDFRSPEPLRGTALKIIRALHSEFGHQSKARFEAMFQTRTEIQPVGSGETTPAEFLSSLQSPFTACQLRRPDFEASFFLVWSTQLLKSLFLRMLGGPDRESTDLPTQTMTSIERRLLSKLNDALLDELSGLLNAEFTVSSTYESATCASPFGSNNSSIWLSFEMTCGTARGMIHVGIPRGAIHSQTHSTVANSNVDGSENTLVAKSLPHGIQKVMVEVSASLATLQMRTSDVATLQVGDILMTDLHPTEPITLKLDHQNLCRAAIGTHSGYKALRLIQSPIQRQRDADG